jgi:hypothetical protein
MLGIGWKDKREICNSKVSLMLSVFNIFPLTGTFRILGE